MLSSRLTLGLALSLLVVALFMEQEVTADPEPCFGFWHHRRRHKPEENKDDDKKDDKKEDKKDDKKEDKKDNKKDDKKDKEKEEKRKKDLKKLEDDLKALLAD